ncbi:MAG: hypothetical protein BVN35_06060 [Proteobacteria bacterium ST_bin11]|nr:MAG: hypothetical protein BVN35_06060 [Proteobacteria bacterium ST_bin11]
MVDLEELLFPAILGVASAFTTHSFGRFQDVRVDAIKWASGRENAKSSDEFEHRSTSAITWGLVLFYVIFWCFTSSTVPSIAEANTIYGKPSTFFFSFVVGVVFSHRKYRSIFYHASHGLTRSPLMSVFFFVTLFVSETFLNFIYSKYDNHSLSTFARRSNRLVVDLDQGASNSQNVKFAFVLLALQMVMLVYKWIIGMLEEAPRSAIFALKMHLVVHRSIASLSVVILYLYQAKLQLVDLLSYGVAYYIVYTVFFKPSSPATTTMFKVKVDALLVNVSLTILQSAIGAFASLFDSFVFSVSSMLVFESFTVNSPAHIFISLFGLALGASTHGFFFAVAPTRKP